MSAMHSNPSDNNTIFAASIAGGISGPVNNVSQLITLHQQNTGLSIKKTIASFPASYKSLHRATMPAVYRGIFFANAWINCLPYIKENMYQHCNNSTVAFMTSALASALFATATTQPMQVIIAKLHADIEKKKYRGAIDAFKKTLATGGIRELYTGSTYRTMGNIFALLMLYHVQNTLNQLK
jgi:hypothetical protein